MKTLKVSGQILHWRDRLRMAKLILLGQRFTMMVPVEQIEIIDSSVQPTPPIDRNLDRHLH